MTYCFRWLLWLIVIFPAQGQKCPPKKEVMATLTLANNYFMQTWPDPGKEIVTNKTRPSNIWTRAVYYEGLMALYEIDKRQAYLDYAVAWGDKHQWGLRSGSTTRNADDQCCGQTYLALYKLNKVAGQSKTDWVRDIKSSVDGMVHNDKIDDWHWIDALQMAMPVFAELGVIAKASKADAEANAYFEKMYRLYIDAKTQQGGHGLYNPVDHLWWRDKDFVPPYKEPNGKNCYWSRGNGWVVAALVRVLDRLPTDAPHRAEYQETFVAMMQALSVLQRADGFWNVSLHDPTHFGGKELTGTALFTYGMAWGVNRGLLSAKKYRPMIGKAWQALANEAVHSNGSLGYVQGTGKEPKDGQPVTYDSQPDFEDYGLGCLLLAGAEVYKLSDQ